MISQILLQDVSTAETRAVLSAVMLARDPPKLLRSSLAGLSDFETELRTGRALPVGSVEFVRFALSLAGRAEPANMSYPSELSEFLGRTLWEAPAAQVLALGAPRFVKPFETKAFTGFVYHPHSSPMDLSEHDQEQLRGLRRLAPDARVWVCEPLSFVCEWRYYARDGVILGQARYDQDGPDEAPEPDPFAVKKAVVQLLHRGPCALDFAVLADGSTVLVEVNDFWALGLYGKALTGAQYLQCLQERWVALLEAA